MGQHGRGHGGLDIGVGIEIGNQNPAVLPPGAYGPEIFGPQVGIRGQVGRGGPPVDPIREEARRIASELDYSPRPDIAINHLQRDLQRIPDPHDQRRLIELVDRFDRKGMGADLMLGGRRGGDMDLWSSIRVVPCRPRVPHYDGGLRNGSYPGGVYPGGAYPGGVYPDRTVPIAPNNGVSVGVSIDLNLFKRIR